MWKSASKLGCASVLTSPLIVGKDEYSDGGIAVCVYDKPPTSNPRKEMPLPCSCIKTFGTISGAASQGLNRAYRADASLVASHTSGDGIFRAS